MKIRIMWARSLALGIYQQADTMTVYIYLPLVLIIINYGEPKRRKKK